jgi:hypothetical protein
MAYASFQTLHYVSQKRPTQAARLPRGEFLSPSKADVWMHTVRHVALIAFLAMTSVFVAAKPASAQSYSVCLTGDENGTRCDFASLAQCQATASGGLGYCEMNSANASNSYVSYRGAGRNHHR